MPERKHTLLHHGDTSLIWEQYIKTVSAININPLQNQRQTTYTVRYVQLSEVKV